MYKCSYWFQADFTLSLLQAALVTSCSVITMTGYQATLICNNHDWISGYTPQSLARPRLATSPVLLASHDITGTAGVLLAVTSLAWVLCILGMPTFPTTWVCSTLLLVILMSKLLLRKFMIPFMTRIGVLRKLESPRLLVAWPLWPGRGSHEGESVCLQGIACPPPLSVWWLIPKSKLKACDCSLSSCFVKSPDASNYWFSIK